MTEMLDDDCTTCTEGTGAPDECPGAQRDCGHHCNCIWEHDTCHWCPAFIDDDGQLIGADGKAVPE